MRIKFIKLFLHVTAVLPLPVNQLLGSLIGLGLYRFSNQQKRVAQRNLELCFPELSEREREILLKQTLRETGKIFTETGIMWLGSIKHINALVREVEGEHYLEEAMAQGRGAVLISPHLGNWELIGHYCAPKYPMINMYRPPRMAAMDPVIRQARQRTGSRLAPTNIQGVRELMKALKNNEIVGILPDQDPREKQGSFAPFFGIQANTITLVSKLVAKSGAIPIFTYAERLPRAHGFRIHFLPADPAVANSDLQTSIDAINADVERCVRAIPSQYQWGYKRFRTRPNGEVDVYKNI